MHVRNGLYLWVAITLLLSAGFVLEAGLDIDQGV